VRNRTLAAIGASINWFSDVVLQLPPIADPGALFAAYPDEVALK
jgi:hypothetical protein